MTYQEHLMGQVYPVQLLLEYLPHCESESEKDRILQEVRNIRAGISEIEEMTRTERKMELRIMKLTIESKMNYDQQ